MSKVLQNKKMSTTISDIARLANVSKSTVSAVINGKGGVSQATRDRINDLIKRLNYRPNQLARSLSAKQTRNVGLVIKEIDNPYFASVMKGVFDKCSEHQYTVLLGSSELLPEQEIRNIETMINHRVDGLIISPLQGSNIDYSYLTELIKGDYPFVCLEPVQNFPVNAIEIDNIRAANLAVSHLIEMGHRQIAFLAGHVYSAQSLRRLEGFRRAFAEHRLVLDENLIYQTGSIIQDGYEMGKKIFGNGLGEITAVFCYNDMLAIGLIDALLELNIRVPEDISVIGFDDIIFSASARVPLTTLRVPTYKVGNAAADLLIRRIENPEFVGPERIVIDVDFIHRESVARRKI